MSKVEIDKNQLVRGQHIYVQRAGGVYTHHGIYVGKDSNESPVQYVIHFIGDPQNGSSIISASSINSVSSAGYGSSTSSQACKDCNYRRNIDGGVLKTCLNCFINDSLGETKLYLYRYGVSPEDKDVSSAGTCSCKPAKSPEEIVKNAYKKLKDPKPRKYNLLTSNCETFATECSTESGESGQADNVIKKAGFAGVGVLTVGRCLFL
ncbi:NC domain-containing-related-like protein [Tripterygium wilfordii]|uniref:NC domain-containing-related-like protein n=1 Tax=Tripterygium wilfordii TaxID=458696 RepID=A0A7J7CV36_TRIWF|nr:uncharacterized protein LOC120013700 [Tripterygium wilfordii]KAF5737829.1 NC domain-containing-related-like protein [Tripterygium wilfordii]